jgi:hypothetical protein
VDAAGVVKLPEGGSFATSGAGTVVFGQTTFGGVGTWTASATGGAAETGVSGVSITSSANGAAIALVPGTNTREAGILTASGASPSITQAIGESNAFSIGAGAVVDITAGSLVLTAGANPATFTGTGKVVAGATEFVGGTGGWTAVGDSGTVTIAATSAVLSSVTAATATGIAAGAGASVTQLAGDGNALEIADNTTVDLGTSDGLVLSGDDSHGGKLIGDGKVVAAHTEIVGGTGGWTAVGTSNTVTIAATDADVSSITATSDGVLTAGAGATITQLAVENNSLTIAASTVVALGNVESAKLGEIVLTGAAENPGLLTLATDTSKITTGLTAGDSAVAPVAEAGVSTADGTAFTAVGLTNLVGDGEHALAKSTETPSGGEVAAGKLAELTGSAGNAGMITGGGDNADGSISAVTETAAVET